MPLPVPSEHSGACVRLDSIVSNDLLIRQSMKIAGTGQSVVAQRRYSNPLNVQLHSRCYSG
jgi:hypothetical protein